jgi:hypothetical protein
MDLNRFYRAKLAGRMQETESIRKRFLAGKIKPKDIDEGTWKLILEMDRIAGEMES